MTASSTLTILSVSRYLPFHDRAIHPSAGPTSVAHRQGRRARVRDLRAARSGSCRGVPDGLRSPASGTKGGRPVPPGPIFGAVLLSDSPRAEAALLGRGFP